MKTERTWNFRSMGSKILLGLAIATMIGSMDMAPAFAKGKQDRGGKHDRGRYDHRGRGYDHGRYGHDRRVYRSYGYRDRVYVPPPVFYAPPPPPGIGIFFPPIIIHP